MIMESFFNYVRLYFCMCSWIQAPDLVIISYSAGLFVTISHIFALFRMICVLFPHHVTLFSTMSHCLVLFGYYLAFVWFYLRSFCINLVLFGIIRHHLVLIRQFAIIWHSFALIRRYLALIRHCLLVFGSLW